MEPMIIAIDVRSLMEGRHSGVEEYAIKIIRALIRRAPGDQFILFCNSWRDIRLPDFGTRVRLVVFRYPNKLLNLWQLVFGWPRWDELIRKKIGKKPTVIFLPNARLMPLADTPLVVTAHDLSYELFPEFYSWRRRIWHKLMRPRHLLRSASHVIAVSQATKEDVMRWYGIKAKNVSVIYSGVGDDNLKRGEENKTAGRAGVNSDNRQKSSTRVKTWPRKFILYLGTMEPRKNIVSVVEAFTTIEKKIPHHLVIAGETGWLGSKVKRAVMRSNARQKIHQIGLVKEEDKGDLYEAADLFVYPSFYEGFGFPVLEALVAGTPVITSHNSSLPEVAGDFAVMVNPYDVAELALVMEELLRDPPAVGAKTCNKIRRRFSWEEAARRTLEVLQQAAKEKRYASKGKLRGD